MPSKRTERPEKSARGRTSTGRELTRRYVGGLLLVALVFVSGHAVLRHRTTANQTDGLVINLAGMQRMLSQQIAFLAQDVSGTPPGDARRERLAALGRSIERMQANQLELLEGEGQALVSPALHGLYQGQDGIRARVDRYTAAAQRRLDALRSGADDAVAASAMARELEAGLLPVLDRAVSQYQLDYEARVENFLRLETLFVMLGLAVLICEALFIFAPMTRHVDVTLTTLEDANRGLREVGHQVSHDLRGPLASTLGLLDMALEFCADNENELARDALHRAQQEALRADEVVGRMVVEASERKSQPRLSPPANAAQAALRVPRRRQPRPSYG